MAASGALRAVALFFLEGVRAQNRNEVDGKGESAKDSPALRINSPSPSRTMVDVTALVKKTIEREELSAHKEIFCC